MTQQEQLSAAENQVNRCYEQMLEATNPSDRFTRGECFRLAVIYRNSLMTPEQLAAIEEARGLR